MSEEDKIEVVIVKHIAQYCLPIFLCLSLLGNSLSIHVLLRTKLRYYTSSIYLGALAMSDIGVLISTLEKWLGYINIINDNNWLHNSGNIISNIFAFLSVWIVVAFTVERYIVINWPFLRRSLCTVNRARIVVIGLTGVAVLYTIPWFIVMYRIIVKNENVEALLILLANINFIANFIMTFALPATIIAVLNSLIVHNICKQNRIRRNLISSSVASNVKTQSSNNEMSHIKITKMLLVISTTFICLNAPLPICILLVQYKVLNIPAIILYIGAILQLINYGTNFILYSISGKNFRREFIGIFTKRSDTRRNKNMQMENYEEQCN